MERIPTVTTKTNAKLGEKRRRKRGGRQTDTTKQKDQKKNEKKKHPFHQHDAGRFNRVSGRGSDEMHVGVKTG
jgi:hypothetical protein